MKRSGDLTAAAVIMFCGSGLFLLMCGFAILGGMSGFAVSVPQQRQAELAGMVVVIVMYGGLAAWGIATGVGILKLQAWARISAIVMSVLAIAGCVTAAVSLFAMQSLFQGDSQLPPNFARIMLTGMSVVFAIPTGIAIWWMILFTRKRVILEFATRGIEAPEAGGAAAGGGEEQGSAHDGGPNAFGSAPDRPQAMARAIRPAGQPPIPVSIRIVAVLYILGSAMLFLSVGYMRAMQMPALLMGKLVEGWAGWTFFIVLGAVQLAICIAVLKRRAWALDGLIAVLAFGMANMLGFAYAPSRDKLLARTLANRPMPPGVEGQTMVHFTHVLISFSLIVGGILALVLLYFLVTRRREFRAACAGAVASDR